MLFKLERYYLSSNIQFCLQALSGISTEKFLFLMKTLEIHTKGWLSRPGLSLYCNKLNFKWKILKIR